MTQKLTQQVGDKIFIKKDPYDKLKPIHEGSFIIKNIMEPNVTIIYKNNKEKTWHQNEIVQVMN